MYTLSIGRFLSCRERLVALIRSIGGIVGVGIRQRIARVGVRKEDSGMADVHDVAAYILQKRGMMTAMKLQKLVYYSQAWSLVWDERPLFQECIEAWANGPVVRELYNRHRGKFNLSTWEGDPGRIDEDGRGTIDAVLSFYGDKSSQWLSDLTHSEDPWRDARAGLPDGSPCEREITHAAMAEYYGSLQ
jgi:uncharacterized phage-associated protein